VIAPPSVMMRVIDAMVTRNPGGSGGGGLVRRIRVAVDRVRSRGEIIAPTTRYHRPRDSRRYVRGGVGMRGGGGGLRGAGGGGAAGRKRREPRRSLERVALNSSPR